MAEADTDDFEVNSVRTFPFNSASQRYVSDLVAATRSAFRIADPSYALSQEPQAWKKIQRDAVIAHCINMRRHLVAGTAWGMTPASSSDQDVQAASVVEQALKKIQRFQMGRFNLTDADFRGSSYAFIEGRRQEWSPSLVKTGGKAETAAPDQWWMPTRLVDVDRFRFEKVRVSDKEFKVIWRFFSVERQRWEELKNPEWFVRHVFEDAEDTLGFGRGLLEGLYFYWYAKMQALENGLQGLERWAQGLLTVAIENAREASTGKPNEEVVRKWVEVLEKMRSRNVIAHDSQDRIDTKDGPAQGHQIVEFFLNYLDNAITRLCLGSVLPTGGDAGGGGSFARAQIELESTEGLVQLSRAQLSESITEGPVKLFWNLNQRPLAALGLADAKMPSYEIRHEPILEPLTAAQTASTLLNAGIDLRKDEVFKKTGYSVPGPEDEVIKGRSGSPSPFDNLFNGTGRDPVADLKSALQGWGLVLMDLPDGSFRIVESPSQADFRRLYTRAMPAGSN